MNKTMKVYVPADMSVVHPLKPRVFYPKGVREVPADSYHLKLIRKGKLLREAPKESTSGKSVQSSKKGSSSSSKKGR